MEAKANEPKRRNQAHEFVAVVPNHPEIIDSQPSHSDQKGVAYGVLSGPAEVVHEEAEEDGAPLAGLPDRPSLRNVSNLRWQPIESDDSAGAVKRGKHDT